MKVKEVLNKWELNSLKLNLNYIEAEFTTNDNDKDAAWEMYVELVTRILTQNLNETDGDEETALTSVYSLFGITRDILKQKGRKCDAFSKIAVIILNQIVRPFTAKWHKRKLEGALENKEGCIEFRNELKELQKELRKYAALLADIAEVEDITVLNYMDC